MLTDFKADLLVPQVCFDAKTAFLQAFPDAKIIYTARDPTEVIPSTLSLLRSVIRQRFPFDDLPKQKQFRYYRRISRALVQLMERFHAVAETISAANLLVLPYRQLKDDFSDTMYRLLSFVESDVDLSEAIRHRAESQKKYKSHHHYDLSEFGLTAAQIREDCAFFDRYWK